MPQPKPEHLLTLLEGSIVQPPLGTRILKKDVVSSLLTGEELIKKIKEEGDRYKIEAAKEVETIREKALQEGFEAGYEKWLEAIHQLEEEIKKVRGQVEKQIVPVAIKAAQKVVAKELETHPETILDIVRGHLKAVAQHKRFTLYVSREEFDILDKSRNQLKEKLELLEAFSIRIRDDLKPGSVVIETEAGIVNATIENQWARIERAFQMENK